MIQLDKPMQSIFNELKEWLSSGYGSRLKTPDDHVSKMFIESLKKYRCRDGETLPFTSAYIGKKIDSRHINI